MPWMFNIRTGLSGTEMDIKMKNTTFICPICKIKYNVYGEHPYGYRDVKECNDCWLFIVMYLRPTWRFY